MFEDLYKPPPRKPKKNQPEQEEPEKLPEIRGFDPPEPEPEPEQEADPKKSGPKAPRTKVKPPKKSKLGESIIGAEALFEGVIQLRGDLRVDGTLVGDVDTPGSVLVGPNGTLDGNVRAATVYAAGIVRGDVNAHKISVTRTGRILGDLTVVTLNTEDGAIVNGRIILHDGSDDGTPSFSEGKPEQIRSDHRIS